MHDAKSCGVGPDVIDRLGWEGGGGRGDRKTGKIFSFCDMRFAFSSDVCVALPVSWFFFASRGSRGN